ncbi:Gfo/Idh/MocA family protein [Microbacterium lushaniae]|uniref:Gfo/Idh/MocA family oxidoreductase n=1 Tax=Microbacterium lushaniae TaxID=2614639 RepID=A0A5J6L2K0_9MICO|nr:Gfo/Idh/MocA family oxidoreductase [Microbacterium lushaniae]QEW02748.1 Gfo/Idh/MocA family oxidoreductase [Microbacterium lushaniae]
MEPFPRSDGALGWGILATGGIAGALTRDLLTHGHRVTAVGSRSLPSAEAFAARYGIPRAYGSYEELAADPGIDVIYVATPHNFHAQNATLALEHGKHVLVEKSFTLTQAEASAVTELAARKGLVVLEAMWTRFLPHMAHVRDTIAAGRLGDIRHLHADHAQSLPRDDSHRLNNPALAGGALLDLGIYPISFAHDILGVPVDIAARATLTRTGVDASVATTLTHRGGAISTSFSSLEARGSNRATIVGTKGRLELADTWYAPTTVSLYDERNDLLEVYDAPVSGRGMQFEAAEMERLVREGLPGSPLIMPAESVAIMGTMDAVRETIGLRYQGE